MVESTQSTLGVHAQEREDLRGKMAVIKAQMKAAHEKFNRLDFTTMTKKQKTNAKREFKREGKELEDGIKDVLERIAAIDCREAYEKFVEAKAYI